MDSKTIREKYLKFFEDKGHKVISSASLIPEDGSTLFVSAGMQPLVPYLMGKAHPEGTRIVNYQRCLRTDDIDEVGDASHHTFFEMLGNWSLGDYFKQDSIKWSHQFLTEELNLDPNKLSVTVFEGDQDAPKDNESIEVWKSLGFSEDRITPLPKKDNWWGPVGNSGPCGPDTEIFYWVGEGAPEGNPSNNSGWVEIWNNVFMEYNKNEDGSFEPLAQKNVDTGMGLERITSVLQREFDDYRTDLFWPIIDTLQQYTSSSYDIEPNQKTLRIISDHIKASTFLILDGVIPANKEQGYILRRLLRRAAVKMRSLTGDLNLAPGFKEATDAVFAIYNLEESQKDLVNQTIEEEINKFIKTLDKGLKEIEKIDQITGKGAFDLYQTYGFPLEITKEIFEDKGQIVNEEEFKAEFEAHKEQSRTASAGMFKGGLQSTGEVETKYHTATHLLHAALRQVLGDSVIQRGSNITPERMRFDFSFNEKLTDEQIKQVEQLVNQQIQNNLEVTHQEMDKDEAEKTGAIHAFGEKYGDIVTVYSIGDFSKEFCGGPHVENTSVLGDFKIQKEESAGAGIRRIYAVLR